MKKNTSLKIVNFLAAILFAGGIVSAQSTGYMNPTDTALPHGWTNPLNGMVSDSMWATATHRSGCNCPFVYFSWDEGVNYTTGTVDGIFPYNVDGWRSIGTPTDTFGHHWVDSDFSNKNFRVKIASSSTLINQGYRDFNFTIPPGAKIEGIELNMQFHTDSATDLDCLNAFMVDVYYSTLTGIGSSIANAENIELFPNPAHNTVTMHLSGLSQLAYSIYSVDGRMIMEKNSGSISNNYNTAIDLQGVQAGIYFIKIESNLGTEYRKFVVQ